MPVLNEQRQAITTASLRAAVAWSRRAEEKRAWHEVSRMTGVIMHAFGPGSGPVSPSELVSYLHQPLGNLLPPTGEPSPIDDVILLGANDRLSDQALDIACDYNQALFDSRDQATSWLPSWAWQRAEQLERELFQALIQAGPQEVYEASRRFLIERPAGNLRKLDEERTSPDNERYAQARRVANYGPILPDRRFRLGQDDDAMYWWPCPVCAWPMQIQDLVVRCTYSPHSATFRITRHDSARVPILVKTSSPRTKTPRAQSVLGAGAVDPAVWRFIVVPGKPELILEKELQRIPGVAIEMWPIKDTYDLVVTAADGHQWRVDVKDHVSPNQIIDKPPAAEYVVVPDYRRGQVGQLKRDLPGKEVRTIKKFVKEVREHSTGNGNR